jgi:hydroxyethylthiazole kinase
MAKIYVDAGALLEKIRQHHPMVHHLTNWVTIYDCAQVVKVLGGSPVMAHAPEEAAQMTGLSQALVLNIGTLTVDMVEAMKLSAAAAKQKGIPVVLDVCGAGATDLRDHKCFELLDTGCISLIKGNASEIARVSGIAAHTRGVDAGRVDRDLAALARRLAGERQATVALTGPVDLVTDGLRLYRIHNGHPLMGQVVGTGCMAASLMGAFAAVEPKNLVNAAAAALVCFGMAAQQAAALAKGPATFKEKLFDCLYSLDTAALDAGQQVEAD